ncbi:GNAT family N-acetyltransferase [Streptomyces sp. NPDC058612]|uniref:GNAT family N-acetyltransferase n=1 Tax=Streptomyces sp. NPDC058612 TaxID=3346555 RepID=UPI00364929D1
MRPGASSWPGRLRSRAACGSTGARSRRRESRRLPQRQTAFRSARAQRSGDRWVHQRVGGGARTGLRCGPRALGRTLRHLDTTDAGAPPGAWTLEFVGVRPGLTGRGAGRLLLNHVLATTPAPHSLYLTTADPANVRLYRHFGFTALRETPLGRCASRP